MYASRLKNVRLDVFPRDEMHMSADNYLEYIPIAWTTINAANGFALSGDEMWNMMVISMLNYQADEYMESVVACLSEPSMQVLRTIIGTEIRNRDPRSPTPAPFSVRESTTFQLWDLTPQASDCGSPPGFPALKDVAEVLSRYIRHVKQHKALLQSSESAQLRVTQELEKFLVAHIAHNSDNAWLRERKKGSPTSVPVGRQDVMPYFDWVRTTGANDTSCPYSFAFFCCLISGSGPHCLSSMDQRYLAREMCLHLATLCRQYNDYGSATRDDDEGNLNSLHFSEFDVHSLPSQWTTEAIHENATRNTCENAKRLLMKVAGIERAFLQFCWDTLSATLNKAARGKIKTFINITDLFGQIYIARDIASTLEKN